MHDLVVCSSFDADLYHKMKPISYSTPPHETVTIEKAILFYEREEERALKQTIRERREELEKWLGLSVRSWDDKRVHATYQKEYQKRLQKYKSINWGM